MTEQRGREKGEDERFCSECGDPVKRVAVVCVHCDAELRPTVGRQDAWSGTRLEPEVAGSLCYLFAWLTGIIFLLVEKDDEYVRFHARQAVAFGVALVITGVALFVFSSIGDGFMTDGILRNIWGILSTLAWTTFVIISLTLWVILMVKAYQGERFKLLWLLGDISGKLRSVEESTLSNR